MAGDTMKRIALWALGAMLPREQVFDRHIRHMARGVTLLVCGGMIVAAVFLAALAGLSMMLVESGLSTGAAVAITAVIALLGATVCFLLADRSLNRASKLTEELKVSPPKLPRIEADLDLQEGANILVHAFLDGLLPRRSGRRYTAQKDLFDYEMDEEIGDVHLRGNVHVEREYDEEKDVIHFRPRAKRDEMG